MKVKNETQLNPNGKAKKAAASKSPKGGKKPFSVKGLPTPSWTEKQLAEGARYQWSQLQAAEKKAAVHVFRLGAALALLKPSLKKQRRWAKFLKEMKISEATAWRATELSNRAKTEDQVALLTITEAYEKFGIIIQPQIPADDGDGEDNAAETGGKKKAVVKKAAAKNAKKTSPKDAKGSTNKDEQEEAYEEVDQDEDFDYGVLFDEVAKRNGWDLQRQLQAMVDFYSPSEALSALLLDLDDDAADFKDFLAEQEKLPPPQEANSPFAVLVMLRNRLDLLTNEIKAVDWAKESAADYLERLDELVAAVEGLRKAVRHE